MPSKIYMNKIFVSEQEHPATINQLKFTPVPLNFIILEKYNKSVHNQLYLLKMLEKC